MLAKILGPAEHGANYRSITEEHSNNMVTYDCAPIARMFFLEGQTPPQPTLAPSTANWSERRYRANPNYLRK